MRRGGVHSELLSPSESEIITTLLPDAVENVLSRVPPLYSRISSKVSPKPDLVNQSCPSSSPTSHNTDVCKTLRTNSRVVTAIVDPAVEPERGSNTTTSFDHSLTWNDRNGHIGFSLPSQRSRQRPALLNRQVVNNGTNF